MSSIGTSAPAPACAVLEPCWWLTDNTGPPCVEPPALAVLSQLSETQLVFQGQLGGASLVAPAELMPLPAPGAPQGRCLCAHVLAQEATVTYGCHGGGLITWQHMRI